MAYPPRARSRGRRTPPSYRNRLLAELGWSDLSWPVVGWTMTVLALGFGPLLLAALIDATGLTLQFLAALGPVLVCLALAGLTWKYGMRYARDTGRSKQRIWLFVTMFVALAGLVGWALFVSV